MCTTATCYCTVIVLLFEHSRNPLIHWPLAQWYHCPFRSITQSLLMGPFSASMVSHKYWPHVRPSWSTRMANALSTSTRQVHEDKCSEHCTNRWRKCSEQWRHAVNTEQIDEENAVNTEQLSEWRHLQWTLNKWMKTDAVSSGQSLTSSSSLTSVRVVVCQKASQQHWPRVLQSLAALMLSQESPGAGLKHKRTRKEHIRPYCNSIFAWSVEYWMTCEQGIMYVFDKSP